MIPEYDLCIIGGGINGAGIARDAAGRGLRVVLAEKGDLASATSSASTKLIHGGLRYLEYFEFGLVRDSLKEREILIHIAPHIVRPLQFVLPQDKNMRPAWMIGAGLFLYDRLARRMVLEGSRRADFRFHPAGKDLKESYKAGFLYTDCWTDDSRLTVLNALDAAEHGAEILTRMECTGLQFEQDHWIVSLEDRSRNFRADITAGAVINAAGPWVYNVIERFGLLTPDIPKIRLVKGSHIIIPRAFTGSHAYILQQPGKRIIFAIPYEDDFTLVGTTEESFSGDPGQAMISDAEIEYLCAAFNRSFRKQITREDIIWTYSGVRPLFDDGRENATKVTRDYRLHQHREFSAPLVSVFGGKLTTYRVLAEKAVTMIAPAQPAWTGSRPLPGGDIPHGDFDAFVKKKKSQYEWLPAILLERYARAYGTRMDRFLEGAEGLADLGRNFGDDIYEAEILYLVKSEWARTPEDILWRRSKLGLGAQERTIKAIETALPGMLDGGAHE
ncbi:MAG: glycerol-3-phosphate dehydrogenase [Alphaproteobacteria bacterium]|nr:glycerol-3-phosphate dehydrogenase [Alphaproteobacteria bacterium]